MTYHQSMFQLVLIFSIKCVIIHIMKILCYKDIPVAKFKNEFDLCDDFTYVDFDKENRIHKKVKFITIFNKSDYIKDAVKVKNDKFTILDLLIYQSNIRHGFYSIERKADNGSLLYVSKSELKRWIVNNSLEINGFISNDPDEEIDYYINSMILFPKNEQKRNTIL